VDALVIERSLTAPGDFTGGTAQTAATEVQLGALPITLELTSASTHG
jgi:hypothetical protein